MNDKNILTLDQASSVLGIPAVTLRGKLNKGELSGVKIKKGTRDIWGLNADDLPSIAKILNLKNSQAIDYENLVKDWLNGLRTGLIGGKIYSENTIRINIEGINNYWRYSGLQKDIRNITASHLIRTLAKYPIDHVKRKCSFSTKEHTKKALISLIKFLIIEGLSTHSLLSEIGQVEIVRVYEARKTKLRKSQISDFFDAINKVRTVGTYDNSLSRIMVALLLYTGVRKNELLNLQVTDIHLNDTYLLVRDGKGKKTRRVGLLPEIIVELKAWLQEKHPGFSLLTMKCGEAMTESSFNRRFGSIVKRSGFDITPHGLRRTFATIASLKGIPLEIISKTLGHNDIKTTQGYLMADEEDAIEIFASCQSFFGNVEPIKQPETIDSERLQKKLDQAKAMGLIS